jgi:hypothetical protein
MKYDLICNIKKCEIIGNMKYYEIIWKIWNNIE